MWKLFLALTILSGCGPEYIFEYPEVNGLFYVRTNVNYKLEGIENNLKYAKKLMINHNIVQSEKQYDEIFKGTIFTIRADKAWMDPYLGMVLGITDPFLNIEVDTDMDSTLHEMIHRVEAKEGKWNTGDHPKWKEKGYYDLETEFINGKTFLFKKPFPF